MPCLIFLSAIWTHRCALADPLSGEEGDVNLFLSSDGSSLPLDDSSSLPDNSLLPSDNSLLLSDDLTQWPVSPDDPIDNIFDETEPVDLAGVNDLCAADEDTSLVGKM